LLFYVESLLFHDLQQLHGTSLDTDAAGDALGGRTFGGSDHNLHGADFHALAARGAQLLADHVHAGLGVLSDCTSLADLGTLTALDAGHGLSLTGLLHDLDAGQILVELLVEGSGAGVYALQTSHTLDALFNAKLFHKMISPYHIISLLLYRSFPKISMVYFQIGSLFVKMCIFTKRCENLLGKVKKYGHNSCETRYLGGFL
jgi:hypothetical protein